MKKKINILCTLMLIALVLGVKNFDDFRGKNPNIKYQYIAEGNIVRQHIDIFPDNLIAADTLYSATSGEAYDACLYSKHIAVKVPAPSLFTRILVKAGSLITSIALILFWVCFIRLIVFINKGVFNEMSIKRIRWMGWLALIIYPGKWLSVGIPDLILRRQISFEGYEIAQTMPQMTWLIIGFGLLMFSLIMKMGMEMKEEQDLTI
ncbi:MAG: DUF2975 domain-containing protein [Bacteroidales bacterium]|nr:DUF2975 domain-containing protein [Bacteroidales bacterium]